MQVGGPALVMSVNAKLTSKSSTLAYIKANEQLSYETKLAVSHSVVQCLGHL